MSDLVFESEDGLSNFIAESLDDGEIREGQLQMTKLIAEAIENDQTIYVEAGTGIGKSLAYSLPALLSMKARDTQKTAVKKLVISTQTKALQDQLFNKDLPQVFRHLNISEKNLARIKGRKNYVCLQRCDELEPLLNSLAPTDFDESSDPAITPQKSKPDPTQGKLFDELDIDELDKTKELLTLLVWSKGTKTGDFADFSFSKDINSENFKKATELLSVNNEECLHKGCPAQEDCFSEKARKKFEEVPVLILNHSFLCETLNMERGEIDPFEEKTMLVVDEAHKLEDVAAGAFGVSLSRKSFSWIVRRAKGILTGEELKFVDDLDAIGKEFIDSLIGELGDLRSKPTNPALFAVQHNRAMDILGGIKKALSQKLKDNSSSFRKIARVEKAVNKLQSELYTIQYDQSSDYVCFIEAVGEGESRSAILKFLPIVVQDNLRQKLDDRFSAKIFCSATLSQASAYDIGYSLGSRDEYYSLESPFDYPRNGLLLLYGESVLSIPPPGSNPAEDDRYIELICKELQKLIEAAGGRTLALFSSIYRMKKSYQWFRENLDGEFPLLIQGERPTPSLVKEFAENPKACLFGTKTFWEGVDVLGHSLSLVAIDRIPFKPPDDPMAEARKKKIVQAQKVTPQRAWQLYEVPRVTSEIKQAIGRLIRSKSDRGVAVIFDSRMTTKLYGREILQALPPFKGTIDREEAEDFLHRIREDEEKGE